MSPYAHHWTMTEELDPVTFQDFKKDVARVFDAARKLGMSLCGPSGTGNPIVNDKHISFNGDANCGHTRRMLGQPWPHKDAHGITVAIEQRPPIYDLNGATLQTQLDGAPHIFAHDADIAGLWHGGVLVTGRTCAGRCDAGAFSFKQSYKRDTTVTRLEGGWIMEHCATSFFPYDVVVTAVLLLARHHFPHNVKVETDGLPSHWVDGYSLVRELFPSYDLQGVTFAQP